MTETSGDVLRLLQPVSGTCLRAKDIDEKVMEMDDIQKPDNKCGFDVEFYSLKLIEDMFVYTANEGAKMENMHKNRYRNIIPYDQTRVVLRRGSDDSHCSDYINANYIRSSRLSDISSSVQSSTESLNSVHSERFLPPSSVIGRHDRPPGSIDTTWMADIPQQFLASHSPVVERSVLGALILHRGSRESLPLVSKSLSDDALREVRKFMKLDKIKENKRRNIVKDKSYIATQGCLTNTVNDFWRMIWQEDVRVIAMITNEAERGKKKCERYWPLSGQKEMYNNLLVKSISETYYEDYLLREFDISDKTTCRTVYQYQFTAWPDHSIPAEPDGVLAFIDDINRRMRQNIEEQRAPEQVIVYLFLS
ncbi:Tyrosine-protein phosphatase corkscrew [Papilio xuthus]|uniref:protein-tyrosine-phosphatase n=1 Tax=Papilio xuthus TaxID=66420 RepID=A0A0N0PA72_PAPXU|nr:Tyrosine-protein phosphatase corkscrew [Papilio xuthus]